jgi:hypothetical protein
MCHGRLLEEQFNNVKVVSEIVVPRTSASALLTSQREKYLRLFRDWY